MSRFNEYRYMKGRLSFYDPSLCVDDNRLNQNLQQPLYLDNRDQPSVQYCGAARALIEAIPYEAGGHAYEYQSIIRSWE
jgi:hypothetical protein